MVAARAKDGGSKTKSAEQPAPKKKRQEELRGAASGKRNKNKKKQNRKTRQPITSGPTGIGSPADLPCSTLRRDGSSRQTNNPLRAGKVWAGSEMAGKCGRSNLLHSTALCLCDFNIFVSVCGPEPCLAEKTGAALRLAHLGFDSTGHVQDQSRSAAMYDPSRHCRRSSADPIASSAHWQ